MDDRKFSTLKMLAGALALGEFVSAIIIRLENYPGSFPAGGIIFGGFFLLGTWLLLRRRVTAGSIFVGILCLFEVLNYPGWERRNALDWVFQTGYAALALAGLIAAITVLVSRRRSSSVAAN